MMKKKYFSACFVVLMGMATSMKADLLEDPAEDTAVTPNKDSAKPGQSGLIREDGQPGKSTPSTTPKQIKEEKEKPKEERPTEQRRTQKSDKNAQSTNAPIKYRSERLAGQKEGGVLVLEENVVVTQDEMRIEADKATIHFDQTTNEVIDCVAIGNVSFYQKDPETGNPVTAQGREAIFNNRERTVILKGDPKLVRGGDVVRGRQILYDLTSGWVKADRVEGVVQPTKQDAGKAGKANATKPEAKPESSKP